jgi:hypothetical protein
MKIKKFIINILLLKVDENFEADFDPWLFVD